MSKQKKTPDAPVVATADVVITPVEVTTTESPKAQQTEIEVPAGHVLITALHPDGTEKENSAFFYPERSYKRFYGDETKFRVKKKAN
jgi:hypothetical protein